MALDRWATFDCYGTLIDWNGGIRRELARVFGEEAADERLDRYHEIEPTFQVGGARSYREVMIGAMRELGAPADEVSGLAKALPSWEPFPEVRSALEDARSRGWKLAILSNTDRDFIEASMKRIGVPFELAIVASEIGSYKPGHTHWSRFFEATAARRESHVHVAQSHFHDIAPANELGLRSIWVNRAGEEREPPPTRELDDLSKLPDTLDELVAA
ncbi:MAG: HAD-IA family hydrolase [Actinomycetota bacterium]|nr:HAD-IA family hydrolase [Actinomycetota bacterium]